MCVRVTARGVGRRYLHEDLEAGLLALLGFDQLQGDGLVSAEVGCDLLDFLACWPIELRRGMEWVQAPVVSLWLQMWDIQQRGGNTQL